MNNRDINFDGVFQPGHGQRHAVDARRERERVLPRAPVPDNLHGGLVGALPVQAAVHAHATAVDYHVVILVLKCPALVEDLYTVRDVGRVGGGEYDFALPDFQRLGGVGHAVDLYAVADGAVTVGHADKELEGGRIEVVQLAVYVDAGEVYAAYGRVVAEAGDRRGDDFLPVDAQPRQVVHAQAVELSGEVTAHGVAAVYRDFLPVPGEQPSRTEFGLARVPGLVEHQPLPAEFLPGAVEQAAHVLDFHAQGGRAGEVVADFVEGEKAPGGRGDGAGGLQCFRINRGVGLKDAQFGAGVPRDGQTDSGHFQPDALLSHCVAHGHAPARYGHVFRAARAAGLLYAHALGGTLALVPFCQKQIPVVAGGVQRFLF